MDQKPSYEELEQTLAKNKQTEEMLRHRAEMEALVSGISTSFINVPSEKMDDSINYSLQLVGEFADVDRSYVFLFHDKGLKMDNTHEWCRQGIEPQIKNLKGLSSDIFPWWMEKLRLKEYIHINNIGDLPPEAHAEQELLQSQDILSLIVVPLQYKDELVGFLGFDSVKRQKMWMEEDILLLQTIGDVFVNAIKRKEAEEALERRSEFERLISKISSEFVGLSSDKIDKGIDNALASIGIFSGADRAYVFLFQEDRGIVDNTHEWCAEGIQPQMKNLGNIHLQRELPWFTDQIRKREVFLVFDVMDLPPEARLEREHFESQDIKSLIVMPMRLGDLLVGFLGFDAVHEHMEWNEYEQLVLRLVGETFTNAIGRKLAEKEQDKLRARLSDAVEMAHLGPWEYDVAGDRFLFNDHFYKIYRTTAEEEGGYTMPSDEYFRRYVHPEDMPLINEEIKRIMRATDTRLSGQVEHRIIYADGTTGYVVVRFFVARDGNGKPVKIYGVNQDISERKQAEKKLRDSEEKLARSRKMESLGLLAGGVAHDLNNVLSGIVSYPDLLLLELPEDSKLRKPIQTIKESGDKAVAIVQDLLTIARGAASTREPVNLNDAIREYLASPEFKKLERFNPSVTVETWLDTELLNISGSPIHIRKVIMNLVSNASEAIEENGNIVISTKNYYVDRPIGGYEDVNPGEYAVLAVSDNGTGISPEHLDRIFEPFFTKKVLGRIGTGLGLAVIWNTVQDHEGYIDVKSSENGTLFELYFPITRSKAFTKEMPETIESFKGQGESILVVDDIESQRDISCSMLNALGYKAFAVSGGEEAVEYLKDNPVDLILLDMIMDPGINGRETFERIIKIRPSQNTIIVSGFAETEEVKKAQKLGAGQFVRKPLTMDKLGMAIKKELERQQLRA